MDGRPVTIGVKMTKDDRDIAETDDPLGIFDKRGEIQLIDDMHRAIAATRAEDGFYFAIVDHLLEICRPFGIGAAKTEVLFPNSVPDLDAKSPALDELGGRQDLLLGDIACRTGDADGIAGPEIGWDDERGCWGA